MTPLSPVARRRSKALEAVTSFKTELEKNRTLSDRLADWLANSFGTVVFLTINILIFTSWIIVNLGMLPGVPVFDPFPFGLLTMAVSLEAIALSIIVLISQNRANVIAELRAEVDLAVNVRAEQETTRILNMLDEIHDHLGLNPEDDEELKFMKKQTNIEDIKEEIKKDILRWVKNSGV